MKFYVVCCSVVPHSSLFLAEFALFTSLSVLFNCQCIYLIELFIRQNELLTVYHFSESKFSPMNDRKIAFDVQVQRLELETHQQSGAVVFSLQGFDSFMFNFTLPLPSYCGTIAVADSGIDHTPIVLRVAILTHLTDETALFAASEDVSLEVIPSSHITHPWHSVSSAVFEAPLYHANGVHTLAGLIAGEIRVLRYSPPPPPKPRVSGHGTLPCEEYVPAPPPLTVEEVGVVDDRFSPPPPPPPEPEPAEEPIPPPIVTADPVFRPRLSATSVKYFIDVSDGIERVAEYRPGHKPLLKPQGSPPPSNAPDITSIPQKRRKKLPVVKSRKYTPKIGRKKYQTEKVIPWY